MIHKNSKIWRFVCINIALIASLSLLVLSCAAPEPTPTEVEEPEETIKIGIAVPLTGGAAPWGLAFSNSIQYYADEVNDAGGLLLGGTRYFFKTIVENHKYLPSEAVTAVNKLIFVDKVDFIWCEGGAPTLAVNEICNENQIPLFSDGSADYLGPDAPYTFRICVDDRGQALAIFTCVLNADPEAKTLVIVNADNETGYYMANNDVIAWEITGGTVIDTVFYEVGTIDFYPLMTGIMNKNPDVISFSGSHPEDIRLMAEAARDLGYTGVFPSVIGVSELNLEGTITGGIVAGDPSEPEEQIKFREAYIAEHGEMHPWWPFYGSIAYAFFYSFFPDAGTGDPQVVFETITAPGYTFDTWWGESYWFGSEVPIYGIDRHISTFSPIAAVKNGEWVQEMFVEPAVLESVYQTGKIE